MTFSVNWFGTEVSSIVCECGEEMMVHEDGDFDTGKDDTCEKCGRRYRYYQYVAKTDEPIGRCAGPDCGNWLYTLYPNQRIKKRYCSDKCRERAARIRGKKA